MHHVLVTTGQLIPTLAKLLICGLDAYVPPDSIYSARNESKDTCFGLIEDTYGPFAKYCAIGKREDPPTPPRLTVKQHMRSHWHFT